MRKISKAIAAAAFVLTAGCSVFAANAGLTAKITAVTGKVQTLNKGEENWKDAKIGDVVEEGTIITTGFNSNATLNIDGSVCTLQPLTRLSLEQLTQKDVSQDSSKTVTKTAVYIDAGKATFKVNSNSKKLNDFKAHSPASTASVRGTEFTLYADGTIETTEGLVAASEGGTRTSFNTTAKREDYFISPDNKVSVFTSTYDVGGSSSGMPVYAGEKINVDPRTATFKAPAVREKEELTIPGSSTESLAAIEGESGMAGVPFGFSHLGKEYLDSPESVLSGSGGASFAIEIN